jgi:transmembrane sensor
MKRMTYIDKLNDSDWEELAGSLSEENENQSELLKRFRSEDRYNTEKYWKELKNMNDKSEINVDQAWNKVWSRIREIETITTEKPDKLKFLRNRFLQIAAIGLIILGLGAAVTYLLSPDSFSRKITASTGSDEKNLRLTLPDGSNVFLNRNTILSYRASFGTTGRNVTLSGEAFFEIEPDGDNPFTVDAGKAKVKVTGTSFNVITNNNDSAVEVFVETGQVILSDNAGTKNLLLDAGYIGTIDKEVSGKALNNNPNYRAWNTGVLKYDGQTLDVVFNDLKRTYNMEIAVDDQGILEQPWVTTIDNLSQDTIIRLICASFNLSYTKDGDVYRLARK